MALTKEQLREQIKTRIEEDIDFSEDLYLVFKTAMDEFQLSLFNSGSENGFTETQQKSSNIFGEEIKNFQQSLANLLSKHISDAIDDYTK